MKRLFFVILLFTASCASLRSIEGFDTVRLQAGKFELAAWARVLKPGHPLRIYIEGDGSSWIDRRTPSADPTPTVDTALNLARSDSYPNVVYLARPCQYVSSEACRPYYWTSGRFAPEVVAAEESAVRQLMRRYNAPSVELLGYSGGGAVAALLAARMNEVRRFVTVAGVLDHEAWTALHGDTPLSGSLNPANYKSRLEKIPQLHFVGARDKTVPSELTENFIKSYSDQSNVQTIIVPNATHDQGWVKNWRRLIY